MHPEITPAAVVLLSLLVGLFVHDFGVRPRNKRLLLVQFVVFMTGGTLIVYPDVATRLAHLVGIGRGVDFVIYPLVIWLVREALLTRRRRHEEQARMTELVRELAIERAKTR